MAAQLSAEFGPKWPTDHLAMPLPPLRRVILNHAVLLEMKQRESGAIHTDTHDPTSPTSPQPTLSGGSVSDRIRQRRMKALADRERMLAQAQTAPADPY